MHSTLTMVLDGVPYGPVQLTCTNANQSIPANIVTNTNVVANESRKAIRVIISCEDNSARYAFGGIVPDTSGTGHILYPGASLVIGHPAAIDSFKIVNHTANANANLQITGEYSE